MSLLKDVGDYALYLAATTATGMLAVYSFRSAWYRSRAGRSLLIWMLATAAILAFHATSVYSSGDYPGILWVRLALYSLLAGVNLRWLIVVIQVQNQARRERNAHRNNETGE